MTLLGDGTKEQVLDKAKKLIDRMGPGFVLSQTKMAAHPRDINPENLQALFGMIKWKRLMKKYADLEPYTDEWWEKMESSLVFMPEELILFL